LDYDWEGKHKYSNPSPTAALLIVDFNYVIFHLCSVLPAVVIWIYVSVISILYAQGKKLLAPAKVGIQWHLKPVF
jgi:hypothetical protein